MLIKNILRSYRFAYQAWLSGGNVSIDPTVSFNHNTVYQGKGSVIVGSNVSFGYWLSGSQSIPILIQPRYKDTLIEIGKNTSISNGTELIACKHIFIGDSCRIGARVSILDSDFHGIEPDKRHEKGKTESVNIGKNVWLGNSVTVLKGVTIGRDSIVGANCVVAKDIPNGGIAIGNPMIIIGSVYA